MNESAIRALPTEDLIRMVTESRSEYLQDALRVAKTELMDRGVDVDHNGAKAAQARLHAIGRRPAPPYWFGRPFSREDLQDAYQKKRIGLSGKWNIRQHLETDPIYYTPEARQYLFELARLEGLSEIEIADICQKADEKRKRQDSWKELLLKLIVGAIVVVLSVFVLPLAFDLSAGLGILSAAALVIGGLLFLWKRGW